ncbi:ATP-binding cassette domain-containing protein [Mollicutes bacterium LVI A0039]|nr:ATP-binding cassette domain-containing protein [Mollicutes bacterium LVI A0039]
MIELVNVSKVFADTPVINNVSLSVNRGEIFGLIGLSGAGKSTLLRIINGLETKSSGEVNVSDGVKFGFVFQNFNLVNSLTVSENISLALLNSEVADSEIKSKVDKVLQLVGLEAYAEVKPSKLSGGQKQRVGIARALVAGVDVLLCDEATSALDPFTAGEIISLLDDLNQKLGLTIIFVSHQLEIVRDFCDRIAIIDKGSICEIGTTIDVFSKPKSPVSLKLLGNVLGFDTYLNDEQTGMITCYSRTEINECIKLITNRDIELLATYQHHTKQGIFAHIFVGQTQDVEQFIVRRTYGL